jgi:hypothetical protein
MNVNMDVCDLCVAEKQELPHKKEAVCCVCNRDFCQSHTYTAGYVLTGSICEFNIQSQFPAARMCSDCEPVSRAIKKKLRPVSETLLKELDLLKDQLIEEIRAAVAAKALVGKPEIVNVAAAPPGFMVATVSQQYPPAGPAPYIQWPWTRPIT